MPRVLILREDFADLIKETEARAKELGITLQDASFVPC